MPYPASLFWTDLEAFDPVNGDGTLSGVEAHSRVGALGARPDEWSEAGVQSQCMGHGWSIRE